MKAEYRTPGMRMIELDSLRTTAARFKQLMQHTADGIVVLDRDLRVVQANPAASRMLGIPPEALINQHVRELVPPDEHGAQSDSLAELQAGRPVVAERRILNRAGHVLETEISASPTPDGGIIAVMRDITRRKQSEAAQKETERKYRDLMEGMPYAVAIFQDGRVAYANRASAAIFGLEGPEALIGKDVMGPVPDSERDRLAAWAAARLAGDPDTPDHLSLELLRMGGTPVSAVVYASSIEHTGRPALQVVIQDMSAQIYAPWASEHNYRSLAETLPMAVCIIQDHKLVFVNQTTADMLGYESASEVLEADMMIHVIPEEVDRLGSHLQQWTVGDPDWPSHYITRLRRRDSEEFPVEIHSRTVTFEGRPAIQAIAIDLSEYTAAERSLWASTELYRRMVDLSPNAITVTDLEGTFLVSNPAAARMHGFGTPEEMLSGEMNAFALIDESDHPRAMANAKRVLNGEVVRDVPYSMIRADGSRFPVELSASLLTDLDGKPEAWIAITRDVSRRVRTDEALRASEEQYRVLVDALPHGVGIIQDRRIAFANPACARILGYESPEQIIGRKAELPLVPGERERVIGMLSKLLSGQTEGPVHYTTRANRKDGGIFPVEVFATRIQLHAAPAVQLFLMDISDRVEAEQERLALQAQVQHAQKLESLGLLAGGIAHDFNNLLMAMLGNLGLAQMDLPAESPVHPYLDSIETTTHRAAELTQQMLAYSGRGQFVTGPISLARLVAEMAHLLRTAISKKASLRTEFEPDLPLVLGDATQLRQVIMNLITNASEAIGEHEGIISLAVQTCAYEPGSCADARQPETLPAARHVCIEVTDTGVGMDGDILERIFDPFFTTKFTGRGLGLAAVQGIIRGHQGHIEFDSQPGQGTRCRIWLPVAEAKQPTAELDPKPDVALKVFDGTVLLADDEPSVRTATAAMLRRLGLEVVTAEDGRQALEILKAKPHQFRIAVIDLTMPRVDGHQFLAEARALKPDLPVILASGYSQDDVIQDQRADTLVGFLQKPFTSRQLASELAALLDG